MANTIAVVVGVSSYNSRVFPCLHGAADDAQRVAAALVRWGVYAENIRLLVDQQATRSAILEALRVWPLQRASRGIRLIFFFAGHGCRIRDTGQPECSLILPHDANPADRMATSISLSELMSALARLCPEEAYLFLDACALRMDNVQNVLPARLPDADVLSTSDSSYMFCLVAAGNQSAYEDTASRTGFFTRSLLQQMENLRKGKANCTELAERVTKDMLSKGLPSPEFYIIGNTQGWPLPDLPTEDRPLYPYAPDVVLRHSVVGLLGSALKENREAPLWLWGISGSGKTVIAQQLRSRAQHSTYCSLPPQGTSNLSNLHLIASEIADQLPSLFPSGRPCPGPPSSTIDHVADKLPKVLLIVDHCERADNNELQTIVKHLAPKDIDVILVSQCEPDTSLPVVPLECPRLTLEEVEAFSTHYRISRSFSASFLLAASDGNPLRLRELIEHCDVPQIGISNAEELLSLRRAMAALARCGGYVDAALFQDVFSVFPDSLRRLEDTGLLSYSQDHYVPHDALVKAESEECHYFEPDDALRYWTLQVSAKPQHLWACRMFAQTLLDIGFRKFALPSLSLAVRSLVRVRDWRSLESIGELLVDNRQAQCESAVYISEELVRVQRYRVVDRITGAKRNCSLNPQLEDRVTLVESERAWWYGDFATAIALADRVVSRACDAKVRLRAEVNSGIGYFFRGEWNAAIDHLQNADSAELAEARTLGWARLILGTIAGLRGVDVESGEMLIQSSIRLLTQINDEAGLAVAWGNYGEISWKLGDYRTALSQLKTGLDYAASVDGVSLKLEIIRNLVHVALRLNGPSSPELAQWISKSEEIFRDEMGPTVQMQIWNTLATVAAYRDDQEELLSALRRAAVFTQNNAEYYIYTLGNEALLAVMQSRPRDAAERVREAFCLARVGSNLLAIRQLAGDLERFHELHPTYEMEEPLGVARKWLPI
ncbi:MAG: caspase family protein [Armatimonadetes bacterium]|nr:caspase family protein [Armatimonadota bacterium]